MDDGPCRNSCHLQSCCARITHRHMHHGLIITLAAPARRGRTSPRRRSRCSRTGHASASLQARRAVSECMAGRETNRVPVVEMDHSSLTAYRGRCMVAQPASRPRIVSAASELRFLLPASARMWNFTQCTSPRAFTCANVNKNRKCATSLERWRARSLLG